MCRSRHCFAGRSGETRSTCTNRKVVQTFNFMTREHVLRVSHISILSLYARTDGISLSFALRRLYELDAFASNLRLPPRAFPLRYSRSASRSQKQERIGTATTHTLLLHARNARTKLSPAISTRIHSIRSARADCSTISTVLVRFLSY